MRTITAHEHVRVAVVVEGFLALLALVAFIGALCGLVTWAVVRLATAFLS
jgi:hypothetical protein